MKARNAPGLPEQLILLGDIEERMVSVGLPRDIRDKRDRRDICTTVGLLATPVRKTTKLLVFDRGFDSIMHELNQYPYSDRLENVHFMNP